MSNQQQKFQIDNKTRTALIQEVISLIYEEKERIMPNPDFDEKESRVILATALTTEKNIKNCVFTYRKIFETYNAPQFKDVYRDLKLTSNEKVEEKFKKSRMMANVIIKAMCGTVSPKISSIYRVKNDAVLVPHSRFIFYSLCGILLPEIDTDIAQILGNFSKLECQDCLIEIAKKHKFGPFAEKVDETDVPPVESTEPAEDSFDTTEYEMEILRLEGELRRAKLQIRDLSDGYTSGIEENRQFDQAQFIAKLNSDTYNNLLDMMVSLKNSLKTLRTSGKTLPIEINILPSVVTQLLKFVKDSGITPIIQKTGDIITIGAEDLDNYVYSGSPFDNIDEKKQVRILTTGWKSDALGTDISLPKVEEV